jgi:cathepsin D
MWVLQTGCSGISGDHAFWDPQSSESSENKARSFLLMYGDGTTVSGNQYADKVAIAGFTVCFISFMNMTIEF